VASIKKAHFKNLLGALAALAAMHAAPALTAEAGMTPHKALYDFRLVSAAAGTGINSVGGKMYFEEDDACDAWTTEQRLTTTYNYTDMRPITSVNRYAAFEKKDGSRFSFDAARQEDGEVVEQLRGTLDRMAGGAGKAVYSRPDATSYDLPAGYYLPTAHTVEIVRRARAGEKFFSAVVFDGTDAGGGAEINTFIGKAATAEEIKNIAAKNGKIDAALLAPEAWHVRLAVFPLVEERESEPSYEMDMLLHANGVISHTIVDYKAFALEQILAALEKLPAKNCD
jgi:hypothetical protein